MSRIGAACRVEGQRTIPCGSVAIARGVAEERIRSRSDIIKARQVTDERIDTSCRVVVTRRIVPERALAVGGIVVPVVLS